MQWIFVMIVGLFFAIPSATAGPLHDAARNGDANRVDRLIVQGADMAKPDRAGEPALLIAALAGHAEVVELLLDRGTDVQVRNKSGLTALHAAAYGGHADVVRQLLGRGAAVNLSDNFYRMSPLHAAAEEGHADVVRLLLTHGAEIEAEERNGYTPLTQAGWREYWDAADLLMKAGASCQPADLVGDWLFEQCSLRQ